MHWIGKKKTRLFWRGDGKSFGAAKRMSWVVDAPAEGKGGESAGSVSKQKICTIRAGNV